MVKNALIYLSLVLLVVGSLGAKILIDGTDYKINRDIKYCDSISIKSDYSGNSVCYEKPTTTFGKQTKLIRINNNG